METVSGPLHKSMTSTPSASPPCSVRALIDQSLSTAVVGDREQVRAGIAAFIERTGADELMVTAQIFDHEARKRSFEILADVHGGMSEAA